jgi:hypothetical protein
MFNDINWMIGFVFVTKFYNYLFTIKLVNGKK